MSSDHLLCCCSGQASEEAQVARDSTWTHATGCAARQAGEGTANVWFQGDACQLSAVSTASRDAMDSLGVERLPTLQVVILGIDPDASGAFTTLEWPAAAPRTADGLPSSLADASLQLFDMPMETIALGTRSRRCTCGLRLPLVPVDIICGRWRCHATTPPSCNAMVACAGRQTRA